MLPRALVPRWTRFPANKLIGNAYSITMRFRTGAWPVLKSLRQAACLTCPAEPRLVRSSFAARSAQVFTASAQRGYLPPGLRPLRSALRPRSQDADFRGSGPHVWPPLSPPVRSVWLAYSGVAAARFAATTTSVRFDTPSLASTEETGWVAV